MALKTVPQWIVTFHNPIDMAYIAGFVDGEGNIGFYKPKDARVRMNITIANNNIEILRYIQEKLNVGVIIQRKCYNPRAKTGYQLRIRSNPEARILLDAIVPYLKVKLEQGRLVSEWLASRMSKPHSSIITERTKTGQIVKSLRTDSYTQREMEIVQKVKVLNKRGL